MKAPAPLHLPPAVRRAIVAHARRARPRECCGLLLGDGRKVQFAVAAPNRARGRSRYELDPKTHIDVRRVLRGVAPVLTIVGVYHSHPAGPAVPSPTDVSEAAYADWIHVIVALRGRRATVRAFRIRHGRVTGVPLARGSLRSRG